MAIVGYARVSTKEQENHLQTQALQAKGCDRIYEDKISGATASRAGLDACVASLVKGDTLVVWKLDRLGRKITNLSILLDHLQEKKIHFVSVTEGMDTSTTAGRMVFGLMAVLAQWERETIGERVSAGKQASKALGNKQGKPFKWNQSHIDKVLELRAKGMSQRKIGYYVHLSQPTVARILSQHKSTATEATS